jgi:hypothetical protein
MSTRNIEDLNLLLAKRTIGKTTPQVLYVDNAAGAVCTALTAGKYILKANAGCYWKRGAAGLVGTDVLVTEGATPSTSTPLFANESCVVIVEQGDTDNLIAFRTASGTALAWVIACGDLARQ